MRVSSCTRVKRSNSSGSKPAAESLACARRDCICDSACSSMSRSWARRRSRLPVRSPSEPRSWRSSASRRERVIITSPAWLTSRSSSCERTRTAWFEAARCGARLVATGLASSARPGDAAATGSATGASGVGCSGAACARGASTLRLGRGLERLLGGDRQSTAWRAACRSWPACRRSGAAGARRRRRQPLRSPGVRSPTPGGARSSPSRNAPASRALPLRVCSVAQRGVAGAAVVGTRRPLAQRAAQLRHQFGRLFLEDREQVGVDRVDDVDVVLVVAESATVRRIAAAGTPAWA